MKIKLAFFILLLQISYCLFSQNRNDSISIFKPYLEKNQIYWELNKDVVYNLEISENNIDSLPEWFYFTEKDKNIKSASDSIFLYEKCKIILHPINKDTFQMNIISKDNKKVFYKTKGLLYQTHFTSNQKLSFSYVTDDYSYIYSIFIDPIFNYKSSLGIMRLYIDDFDSFYHTDISTIISGGGYDSLDNYIPDESLKLYRIDTLDNDIIARFKGNFFKSLNGELINSESKINDSIKKLDLDMFFKIDLDYSLKNKQSINCTSEIYLYSEGSIKTKKRIFIKIFKIE